MGLQFQLMNQMLLRDGSEREKGAGKPAPGDSCGQSRPARAGQEAPWIRYPGCLARAHPWCGRGSLRLPRP